MFRLTSGKKHLFLFVLSLISSFSLVLGRNALDDDYRHYLGGERSKSLEFLKVRTQLRKQLDGLDTQIETLSAQPISTKRDERLKDLESDRENVRSLLKGSFGDVFFRGIAGDNWKMVEDLRVGNDILKGTFYGVGLRGAVSIGKTVGKKVDSYTEYVLGGLLGKIEDIFRSVGQALFHNSCKPFTTGEITSWKTILIKDLRDIETMLKNAERSDSRSRDAILKDLQTDDKKDNLAATLWQDFVEDFALTCQELIEEIDGRVGYYEKKADGYGIKNCSNRLSNKLFKLKGWVTKVKTLKEFSNIPEIKSVLPAMRNSLDGYFINLNSLLNPADAKNSRVGATTGYQNHGYSSSMDNGGPFPGAI